MNNRSILTASDLHKSYPMGKTQLHVLRGVSLSIQEGEMLAIMGASGSGKSTLLHILGCLDVPDRGSVEMNRQNLFYLSNRQRDAIRNREVGFVFQFYHLLPEFNVLENVLMPLMIGSSVLQWPRRRRAARQRVCEILSRVGLANRLSHKPAELSGGERQRVAIARAMANQPRILLADEPTGNLDAKMGMGILDVLRSLNREGQTLVMVTHDASIAKFADRCVQLVDGRIQK